MFKKKKMLLSAVLASTLLLTGVGGTSANAAGSNLRDGNSRGMRWSTFSRWMENTWDEIKDDRYCDIVMLGSHDAQTYNLRHYNRSQIAKQLSPKADKIAKIPFVKNILDSVLKKITLPKSITQEVNVYSQLHEGSRFLDIRFKPFKNDGKIRAFHGMFGDEISTIANQIKDFIKETDKEIIFINFNRYGEMWDVSQSQKEQIGKEFQRILGRYIFTENEFSFTKTLEELEATGKRIVLNTNTGGYSKYLTTSISPGYSVPQAQYGSQKLVSKVMPELTKQYNREYRNTTDPSKLNQWYQVKLQLSMTPEETFEPVLDALKSVNLIGALKRLNSTVHESLRDLTVPYRREILDFMNKHSDTPSDNQPNVWLRDFYSYNEVALAVSKNFGGTKSQRLEYLRNLRDEHQKNPNDEKLKSRYIYTMNILKINNEVPSGFDKY